MSRVPIRYLGGMPPPLLEQRCAFTPMWYWLHAADCGGGQYRALPVDRQPWPAELEWFDAQPLPAPAQAELFSGATP